MENKEITLAELIAKGFDSVYPENPNNLWTTHRFTKKGWVEKTARLKGARYDLPTHCFGFFDWFCADDALAPKAKRLFDIVKSIAKKTKKFDPKTTYVFFKNNCPVVGNLYDDVRVCDMETGDVLYTIVPNKRGKAEVWGEENNFEAPLIGGVSVKEVREWFGA